MIENPALIIFGAAVKAGGLPSLTLTYRTEAAIAFGARCKNPLYIPTGASGLHPPAEADVMRSLLLKAGIPDQHIAPEPTGTDTLSSVKACVTLLRSRDHTGPVFAVTSAYHLPRCVVLLRLAGLDAHAAPPPPHPASRFFLRRWHWRLRELPALPLDAILLLAWRLRARIPILAR